MTLPSQPDKVVKLPDLVGKYELVQLLSARAGVSVFRARVGEKPVVIKLSTDAAGVRALEGEVAALTALQRPGNDGVLRLVEVGERAGQPWFAAAWGGEQTLRDYLDGLDGALSHERAARIVHELAEALGYVHAAGWVHGDLNPSNVVMGDSRAMLIDFGAARCLGGKASSLRDAPARGTATPGYIAPERLLGRGWDSRADVYALGCIWFELLAGRALFQAADRAGLDRQHAIRAIPNVPAVIVDLEPTHATLLSAMLAKDPRARPADLRDVAHALARVFGFSTAGARHEAPLFESRLFGRSEAWSTLRRHVNEAAEGAGGVTLVVGAPGTGRTRLLAEAAELAIRAGLRTIELSRTAAQEALGSVLTNGELGWLALADNVRSLEELRVLQERARCLGDPSQVLLLIAIDEVVLEIESGAGASFRVLRLAPLSRDASRRVVSDIFASAVDEGLQTLLWRHSLGNAAQIRRQIEELRTGGRLMRSDGVWFVHETSRQVVSPPSATQAAEAWRALVELRRAAALEQRAPRPDENKVNQLLEASLVQLRPLVTTTAKARRVGLRLGYQLVRRLSKAADHNSVHALSRELLEWCGPEHRRLDAKLRRLDAHSYRVVGENAEAIRQLQLGLLRLDSTSPRLRHAEERERILNRLAESWAHYSAHDGQSSLVAAKAASMSVKAVGTPAQRAEALLHVAKALALIERYRCPERVIRMGRRAVALLRRHGAPAVTQVAAQGNLAFFLLMGDRAQSQDAVEVYEAISAKAHQAGDVLELTRVATYLAVGYRRIGRLADCEAQSRLTLELSRQCGQPGYVGVARACLGWLAFRQSETEIAVRECQAALQVWQRRRGVDPSRHSEYPFQWLGLLPLIAARAAAGGAAIYRPWLDDLLHPTQARLAEPLQACLEGAIGASTTWSPDAWDDWSDRVVRLASAHAYL